MKDFLRFVLISSLAVAAFGCSANSTAKDAEDARANAAEARADAVVADARVKAADAHVRAADAAVDAANADARIPAGNEPAKTNADKAIRAGILIPSGTVLKVALLDALDSDTSKAGDNFMAHLSEAVMSDGATLLQKGTQVRGRVVEVEEAGRIKGRASIRLALTDIVQGDRMVPITTETFAATADSTQGRDTGVIAGGAGVGAVIGAIAGGKKGAAIGAATGGGAGTGVVLATKGKGIHYGPETRLNFTLSNPVRL
jgi:hypothetical protein